MSYFKFRTLRNNYQERKQIGNGVEKFKQYNERLKVHLWYSSLLRKRAPCEAGRSSSPIVLGHRCSG